MHVRPHQILHLGGIMIVSTPTMAYMAKAAFEELQPLFPEGAVGYGEISFKKFSRGEVLPTIECNVRMKHVYLFYDFNGSAGHDSFALLQVLSALQDAGVDRITLIAPYLPYLRQDRKDRSRVPISAKVFIRAVTSFESVKHIVTLDMHSPQLEAAFPRAPDHLPGYVIFAPWIRHTFGRDLGSVVIVGPDFGSEKRVEKLAEEIGCEFACFSKRREGSKVTIRDIHGADVRGKVCIVNDDILDTCGTMTLATAALRQRGAAEIYLTGTHAVFGGAAYANLAKTGCQVVVTDSLRTEPCPWLTVLPLARYLGHAILQNNIADGSVSKIIRHGLPPLSSGT